VFTFIESTAFERVCAVYLDDDEYSELQQFMMENPEAGQMVPGSGGVRKLRWKRKGMGKRGGLRVIYFVCATGLMSSGCLRCMPKPSRTMSLRIFSNN
jgi:hypothetical protein